MVVIFTTKNIRNISMDRTDIANNLHKTLVYIHSHL